MTETPKLNKHYLKCPHCTCIFFSKEDLDKHMATFGSGKVEHEYAYKKTHNRLEHGYGNVE
ncbi:MAG: hypothetical protein GX799_06605 [Crenarchaeota archaeon]|jgi:uncharacterized C2H2 Zn-finger protein|nr:hypothetical protein [Thermoproteota archaeon]